MFPFERQTVAAVSLLSALSLLSGCEEPTAATLPTPKVTTTAVVAQKTMDFDEYTGQTEASEIVEVRARIFGYLKSIDFTDGDYVEEGQTLFHIEPDEYEAIHEQSVSRIKGHEANLALAKVKLGRNEKLVKTGAVSREEYDESAAAVEVSEAAIGSAKADANRTAVDLKYTEVKAPIHGRIDRALVSKGNLLTGGHSSGTLLTKIVDEQPMYVYFDVDERSLLRYMRAKIAARDDSGKSSPGSLKSLEIPCYVQLADEKDFPHVGSLDFASAEVKRTTGTARIRGVFKNEKRELVSGLFVRVRVPVSKEYDALFVPETALATDQSIKYVFVVGSDGAAERRNVELGGQRGSLRIIKSGLNAGEQVIVKGLQRVRPGQKVEAEKVEPEAPPPLAKPAADEKPESPKTEPAPVEPSTPAPEQK